ncbi:MAG: signal peptidase II, partial [Elusimicrobiales bacterium]|nr:signal peptidase II [Elusimicrobiales bacterium]
FAAAMLAGLFLYRKRIEEGGGALAAAGLALVAGGALGNLWDRIAYGAVTDFIDFRVWPVFNAADSFISVGAALMAFAFCFNGADKPPSEETK